MSGCCSDLHLQNATHSNLKILLILSKLTRHAQGEKLLVSLRDLATGVSCLVLTWISAGEMQQPSRCLGGIMEHGAACVRCQEQQDFCVYAVLLSWSNITQADKANSHQEPFAQAKDSITLTPEIWLWSELPCFLFSGLQGARERPVCLLSLSGQMQTTP